MDHPYQKLPLKRGQCRFCPEIHPKFSVLLRHEATHKVKKEDPQPEVTKDQPGKPIIKQESDNVDILHTQIQTLPNANVQNDESSPDAGVPGETCHSPSKNFGPKLPDSVETISHDSQMDPDAEIKERIRNYDWTKDFQKIYKKGGKGANYKCKICSKLMGEGRDNNKFLLHTFVHTGERPFQCGQCPKRYKTGNDKKRHEILHSQQSYICHKCSQEFNHPRYLYRHMKSRCSKMQYKKNGKRSIKIQNYAMDEVTRDDQRRMDLKLKKLPIRRRTLNEKKKRRVDFRVQKSTNSQVDPDAEIKERIRNYDLTKDFRKIEIGGGKVAYECKICSFRLMRPWKTQLFLHTLVHSGERPYQCSMCPKTFKNPQDRKSHQNIIHFGVRAYKCSKCSKDFTRHNHLSRHIMKSHTSKMHPKNIQENKKNVRTNKEVIKNAILCLDRVEHVKEHSHLYSQALQKLNNSLPERILKEIGTGNGMDLDAEIEIKCPELPYKSILCSERFGEPETLYNHQKTHFSNVVEPPKDTHQKDEHEIRLTRSKAKNNIEIKSEEIVISVNPMDILQIQHIEPDGNDQTWSTFPKEEITIPTPKMTRIFGPKLPIRRKVDLRVRKSTNSGYSQVDPDAEIKERFRNYDWTKDYQRVSNKNTSAKVAYKCKICSYTLMGLWKWKLLLHTFVHTGERLYQCHQCPKKFRQVGNRRAHEKISHTLKGRRPYECGQCFKNFSDPNLRYRHMKLCAKGNPNNNTEILPTKNEILQEIPNMPDFKLGFIQNVKISLSRVDKVEEHMDIYGQALERLQNSDFVGVGSNQEPGTFTEKAGKQPKNSVKTDPESIVKKYYKKLKNGRFECLQCHQRVKYPREHRWTHLPSKIPCNICGKNFKRVNNLNRHVKNVHLGIRRNILKSSCRFCGKKIANYRLRNHEESHQCIKSHV